ncbi:tryptophan synthase subunit alpha, partial [Staphylococcus sp. SIMBA_130]
DPLADGPVIQRASLRALEHGMSLEKAMGLVKQMREKGLEIPVVIFTYYNLLLQLGEERFFALVRENDIDGLLVPDLPFEESEEWRESCHANETALISLVAPTTSDKRLQAISKEATGFLYCI